MAGKFRKQADHLAKDLGALFNRDIRAALLAGLVMAASVTKHDSSNAAVHWLIGSRGNTRPGARKYGKLRDLRGTSSRPGVYPVGKRRDGGRNKSIAEKFVRDRELREVIERIVSGRTPATVFYFYHATEAGSEYAENAEIDKAGMAALAETQRVFQNRMASGKTRKKPL